ncbi:MAG TPA: nicotinamide-nucleotide amidohydrolase family protein [Turneriella sp.]|nr:nicotinamide-nucleotide amidohydrolase family protein [Turneriella sp.]
MARGVRLCITGSEVMNGFVLDRNTQFFASELYALGLELVESRILHDDPQHIMATWKEFAATGDIIVNSGGLGPTTDDLTVDLLCEWQKDTPVYEPHAEKRTRYFFEKRAKLQPNSYSLETALRQARIPSRAVAIKNPVGLAPGIYLPELNFFALPGFPDEIKGMWPEVLRRIEEQKTVRSVTRIIPVWGVGESQLFTELRSLAPDIDKKVSVGVHALPWGCRLFLRAKAGDAGSEAAVAQIAGTLESHFAGQVVDDPLGGVIAYCKEKQLKLAVAESCTGGLAAKQITDIAGVSAIFTGGVVSYANEAKTALVDVPQDLIVAHGAVSAEVAAAMARGVSQKLETDLSLSFTGIAGPDGGSESKPVGTVFVGLHDARTGKTLVARFLFPFGRERFRNATVATGFIALWQYLHQPNGGGVFPLSTFHSAL